MSAFGGCCESKCNKALKRTNNSWLFTPSSSILANHYLPLSEALNAKGNYEYYIR
jgi:hypothetical protein